MKQELAPILTLNQSLSRYIIANSSFKVLDTDQLFMKYIPEIHSQCTLVFNFEHELRLQVIT